MQAISRRSPLLAGALAAVSTTSLAADGGAPLAVFVVPLVIVVAGAVLFALAWLLHLALPRSWPKAQRWAVALVAAPSGLAVLVLLTSGPGFLQQQLARLLLP